MSQQVVTIEHSFFVSQHEVTSDDVVHENNPIVSKTNKFFIFVLFIQSLCHYLTGIGVPTGYGKPSLAAVTEVIPESTGIANLNGIAASFKGP